MQVVRKHVSDQSTVSVSYKVTNLEQTSLDVLIIHELREDKELFAKELVCKIHLHT